MNDEDLQRRAAGLAVDAWDPVNEFGPGRAIETYEEAQRVAFLAGHAAGWRDRARRDDEPADLTVLRADLGDAMPVRIFQRRDDWAGGSHPTQHARRWYPLVRADTNGIQYPVSWAELLLSGAEITELTEGGSTWPSATSTRSN